MGYESDMEDYYDEIRHKKSQENELLHKRNKFELWADKYNHTFEVMRTVIQLLVFMLQLIIIWRIF
jgi:ABC-type lipoprotein release transport system permease subunit